MAVSKKVADAYKKSFGADIMGETVDAPILPSGSAEDIIVSASRIGAEALQSTKKKEEVPAATASRPDIKVPSFSDIKKGAYAASGSAEYNPTKGVGYDYQEKAKMMTEKELQDALNIKTYSEGTPSESGGSQEYKALSQESNSRAKAAQDIKDQTDMLQRKINFQARQKNMGVSALDEAASKVGTDKLTDSTGVNYFNPLFYLAKVADMHITAAKSLGQGVVSAVGNIGSSIDLNAGDNIVGDFGESVADYAKIIKQKFPQLNAAKNIGKWEDPEFYVNGVTNMIPNLLGGMASTAIGAAVGGAATLNPLGAVVGGVAGAVGFGYAMESGNIYEDLLSRGYGPSSAEGWSKAYGAIASLPDAFFHVRGITGAVVHPLMQEVIKKGAAAEMKQTLFSTVKNFGKEAIKRTKGGGIEATTEGLQQFTQNVITSFYDKNQKLFDGVPESFVFGGLSGGGVEMVQNMTNGDIKKEIVLATQNEKAVTEAVKAAEILQQSYPEDKDISDLVLKTREELQNVTIQKQVLEHQYTEGTKENVIDTPEFQMTVGETVDGKYVSTATLTLESTSEVLNDPTVYTTRQEAQLGTVELIQGYLSSKVTAENISETELNQIANINTSLKELVARPNPVKMITENRDVMLLARDSKDFPTFEKAVLKNNLLPENSDVRRFYDESKTKGADYITKQEAGKIVDKYASQIGVTTKFIEDIASPAGKKRLGSFLRDERVIKIVTKGGKDIEVTTPYHEVGHAYFQKVLTTDEQATVLNEVKSNSTKELTDSQAEEILVEDLRAYSDKKQLADLKKRISSPYRKALDSIVNTVKKLLKWFGKNPDSSVSKFYEDVLSMKTPSEKEGYMVDERRQESFRTTANDKAELVVLHNTTIENLKKSVELGGLPVPSLAVTKGSIPFTDFGDITLVGGSKIIDPSLDPRNKVFNFDAYTPTMPEEKFEVDKKMADVIYKNILSTVPSELLGKSTNIYDDIFNGKDASIETLQQEGWYDTRMLYAYISSINKLPSIVYEDTKNTILSSEKTDIRKNFLQNIDTLRELTGFSHDDLKVGTDTYQKISTVVNEYLEEIQRKTGDTEMYNMFKSIYYNEDSSLNYSKIDMLIYNTINIDKSGKKINERSSIREMQDQANKKLFNEWVDKNFSEIFTKKYFRVGSRNIDYTFDNVIRAMSGKTVGQQSSIFDSGFGKLQASSSKRLKTMQSIQKAKDKLVSMEEGQHIYDRLKDEYSKLGMDLEYKYPLASFFEVMDCLSTAFKDYYKGKKTVGNLSYALQSNGFTPTPELLSKAFVFANEVSDMPMSFMEAKPQRGVYLNEFSGVVVPKNQYEQAREVLRGTSLYEEISTYSNEEERTTAVQKISDEKNVSFREVDVSLEEEALKYDTVEEFIGSQKAYYHGTNQMFESPNSMRNLRESNMEVEPGNVSGDSPFVHLSEDIDLAKQYARARFLNMGGVARVGKYFVDGKIFDMTDKNVSFSMVERGDPYVMREVNKGYVGILFTDKKPGSGIYVNTVAVLPENIKTEQQLTDIYNKAHSETVKTESIRRQDLEKSQIELTKKYNTAEDFDNAIDTVGYGNFEIPEIKKHIIINTEGSINIRAAEEKMLEGGNTYFLTKIDPTNLVLDAPNKLAIDNLKNKSSINSDTPIVIGNNGYVIDGNHRAYRALQEGKKIYAYLPGKEFWKRWNTDFYGAANIADTANIKKQENTDVYNKAHGESFRESSVKTIYHGTNDAFSQFDVDQTMDGTVWFTDSKESITSGSSGAVGTKYVMERTLDESKLKLATWDEYDRYSTQELIEMGYDGVKLEDGNETSYSIFYPEKLGINESFRESTDNQSTTGDWLTQDMIDEKKSNEVSFKDALYEISIELELAEAGKRYTAGEYSIRGDSGGWTGYKSTFPQWIPSYLRNRTMLNKALQYIDTKLTFPPARMPRVRELVMEIYRAAANRAKDPATFAQIEKAMEKKIKKTKAAPKERLTYKKFPVPISEADLAKVQDILDRSADHTEVYSTKDAQKNIKFLRDAYKTERELLSRTGSPLPSEVTTALNDVAEYTQAGIEDLIQEKSSENIPSSDAEIMGLMAMVPKEILINSKTFDDMLFELSKVDEDLSTTLSKMDILEGEKYMAAVKDAPLIEKLGTASETLQKTVEKNTVKNQAIIDRLTAARIKMIQTEEIKAQRETERNAVRNVARMVNLVDHKRMRMLENEVKTTDRQYVKDIIQAQVKAANAASIETSRIIKEKLREKAKYKNLLTSFEGLRTKVKKATKTGNVYHVDFARELLEIFDQYDLSSISDNTLTKLADVYDKMFQNEFISDELKEWYAKTIPRVTQKSVRDMSFSELQSLYDSLSVLAEKGKAQLEMVRFMNEEEKQRQIDLAIDSTNNMDSQKEEGRRRDAVAASSLKMAFRGIASEMLSPISFADRIDGDNNYNGVNASYVKLIEKAEQKYYKEYHGAIDELRARVREVKESFTEEEETYLSLMARVREKADGAVKNIMEYMGVDSIPEQVGSLTMDEADQVIDIIQDISEKYNISNALKAIYEAKNNKPFPKNADYVAPLKYVKGQDLTENPDLEVLAQYDNGSANIGEGFSNKRKKNVKLDVRTDLLQLVSEGWGHAFYYVNMQPTIDNVYQVVSSEQYKEHAGEIVSKWWKDYLTVVAQKGRGRSDSKLDPIIRGLRQNFQKAILGFKVTTALIQPSSAFNAAMAANVKWGMDVSASIIKETALSLAIPSYAKGAISESDALLIRSGSGGSVDLYEINNMLSTGFRNKKGMLQKAGAVYDKASMWLIKEVDTRMASSVYTGVKNALLARGVSEEKAKSEAETFMLISQSSTQIADRPLVLSRWGEVGRLAFTFQTFSLGLWSMTSQAIIRNGILKGTPTVKMKAVLALLAIPFFQAFSSELIKTVSSAIKGKDDDDTLEDKFMNALNNTWVELVGTVPFFGQIIKGSVLWNKGYDIAGISSFENAMTGFKGIVGGVEDVLTTGDYDSLINGLMQTAEAGATLAGISGTMQGFDIIEGLMVTNKENKKIQVKKATESYMENGEKNISKYVTQAITQLYTPEEIRVMKPQTKTAIENQILEQVVMKGNNHEAKLIAKMTKNEDKVNMLKGLKQQLPYDDFKKLVEYLKKYKLLSEEAELLIYTK